MGIGSRNFWVDSQLVTCVNDPKTCDQNVKGGLCSRMESSHYRVWITSADLVSEVNLLLNAQWLWRNWLLLAQTPHFWWKGKYPVLLFSSVCIWGWAQGQGTILCWTEHSEPLSSFLHFRNSWQNQELDKMGCDRLCLVLILPPTCSVSWDIPTYSFFMRAGSPCF